MHDVERVVLENQRKAEISKFSRVGLIWTEKSLNSLYFGKCLVTGLTVRLEKLKGGIWQASVKFPNGETILGRSTTAKEPAFWTAWTSHKAEQIRLELGIPDKINWGDFRYSMPPPEIENQTWANPRKSRERKFVYDLIGDLGNHLSQKQCEGIVKLWDKVHVHWDINANWDESPADFNLRQRRAFAKIVWQSLNI